jgi:hypothetical protein
MTKTKKDGLLSTIWTATQKASWASLNGMENVIDMITMYRRNRGPRAAGNALVLRWADAVGINALKLITRIREDEILDSELSEMEAQEGYTTRKELYPSQYVSIFLGNKISMLKTPPKHLANSRIYNEIFDIIHGSYLSLYNDKYSMETKGWLSKKDAIHAVGKNYHLDSVLYPGMINTMVSHAYSTFFAKVSKNKRLKEAILDDVIDEDFSMHLTDTITAEEYDEAIDG